ncbi:MAG: hypothetical protein AB7I19_13245 [Planctomycetota bacterium]
MLPDADIFVSDIQAEAVRFQASKFGVGVVPAQSTPSFDSSIDAFDVVSAISLLTHVPKATFSTWVAWLLSLIREDGVLLFTVHDIEIREGSEAADTEYAFRPYDVKFDAPDGYGDTYVTETFVAQAIESVGGVVLGHYRKGLNRHQDVWLVGKQRLRGIEISVPPLLCIDGVRAGGPFGGSSAGDGPRIRLPRPLRSRSGSTAWSWVAPIAPSDRTWLRTSGRAEHSNAGGTSRRIVN